MIIYNTTFHIENSVLEECIEFLIQDYIPNATNSGFLSHPRLSRIIPHEKDDLGESFSLQFHVKNAETLNYWLEKDGAAIQKRLIKKFNQRVVGFTTIMEEISLE